MFDANMRYLPYGHDFFAKVSGITKDHPLHKLKIRGRIILCKMLSGCHENPTVRFYNGEDFIDITDGQSGRGSWIVYEGNKDGTGFINEESKRQAEQLIGGFNV